jgi:hypothetical protein
LPKILGENEPLAGQPGGQRHQPVLGHQLLPLGKENLAHAQCRAAKRRLLDAALVELGDEGAEEALLEPAAPCPDEEHLGAGEHGLVHAQHVRLAHPRPPLPLNLHSRNMQNIVFSSVSSVAVLLVLILFCSPFSY